jgi:hypothetical protein
MRLPEALAGAMATDPELRHRRHPEGDGPLVLHDSLTPERSQEGGVEGGAGVEIAALDFEVVDHPVILARTERVSEEIPTMAAWSYRCLG